MFETVLRLKPRDQWTKAKTQAEFTAKLDLLLRDLPGQRIAYSQPIEMRLNEMVSGVRADLGVMLYGDDFDQLATTATAIRSPRSTAVPARSPSRSTVSTTTRRTSSRCSTPSTPTPAA